jgi:hypothetical protein
MLGPHLVIEKLLFINLMHTNGLCNLKTLRLFVGGTNWDPEEVRAQYKKALQNLNIKFTYKQIAWKQYYELFNKLKRAKVAEDRKYLRNKVEEARRAVMNAKAIAMTTFFISCHCLIPSNSSKIIVF